jgi:hypothetical protein
LAPWAITVAHAASPANDQIAAAVAALRPTEGSRVTYSASAKPATILAVLAAPAVTRLPQPVSSRAERIVPRSSWAIGPSCDGNTITPVSASTTVATIAAAPATIVVAHFLRIELSGPRCCFSALFFAFRASLFSPLARFRAASAFLRVSMFCSATVIRDSASVFAVWALCSAVSAAAMSSLARLRCAPGYTAGWSTRNACDRDCAVRGRAGPAVPVACGSRERDVVVRDCTDLFAYLMVERARTSP